VETMKYRMELTRGRLTAASVAAVLLLGGYALVRSARPTGAPAADVATTAASTLPGATASELRWEAGKEYVYDLRWSGTSAVLIPGAQEPVDVAVKLEGTLRARAVPEAGGLQGVVMSLSEIRTYDVQMQGKPMFDDTTAPVEKAALLGQEVLARVDRQGKIDSLAFDPKTPARVRQVLERIVEATRITLPAGAGASWEAEETTPTGTCKVRYKKGSGGSLTRERLAYTAVTAVPTEPDELDQAIQRVAGGAKIALDGTGAIQSIDDSETVSIDGEKGPYRASSAFTLTRRTAAPFDPQSLDLARLTATREPNEIDPTQRDQSVVHGMTPDLILATIVDHDRGAMLPRGFVVHASAYGRLHPESSRSLVQVFRAPTSHSLSRTLVMDVLAATGDAAAQEAMGEIVRSKESRAEKEGYAHYLQRYMLLPKPARASAELLFSIYTGAKTAKAAKEDTTADAAAVPLGAVAKKLTLAGEVELGTKIHGQLLSDLAAATGDENRIALLKGLGNGAFAEDDAVVAKYAASPASHVRDQAAFSLRNLDSPLSRATLFALAQDKNQNVAVTAVRALKRQSLSAADWATFRALVTDGKTHKTADSEVVALLVNAESDPGEEARPILIAIKARAGAGTDLADRTEQLLAEDP
jgi:hypothetical protein